MLQIALNFAQLCYCVPQNGCNCAFRKNAYNKQFTINQHLLPSANSGVTREHLPRGATLWDAN